MQVCNESEDEFWKMSFNSFRPNILPIANFGLQILDHQSSYNESIVVAPYLLAYTIYMGAFFQNKQHVVKTIWERGTLGDMDRAFRAGQIKTPENDKFTVETFIHNKWIFDETNRSVVENPVTVEEEVEKRNNAFSQNTDGRIKRLYSPTDIADITLVISLVYNFKAGWKTKFDPSETFEGAFYTSKNSNRNVNFLSIPGAVRKYSENDHFQMLSLPYDTEWYEKRYNKTISLSMNILLPKTRFGLTAALKKTNIWAFQALLTNTEDTYIKATIPKFDIDTHFNFERYLKSKGIEKLIAKPPVKDEETVKEEWKKFYRMPGSLPELRSVYGSAITIGMDENGSHTNDINPELLTKSTSAHKETYLKYTKQKTIIADYPFAFVVLYQEYPVFVGTHF